MAQFRQDKKIYISLFPLTAMQSVYELRSNRANRRRHDFASKMMDPGFFFSLILRDRQLRQIHLFVDF